MITTPPRGLHCSEVIALLYPYLDRELSDDEQRLVRLHLQACGNCAPLFRFEAAVLTLIGERLRDVQAPADLRERIAGLAGTAR